jgi:hypothetical protein
LHLQTKRQGILNVCCKAGCPSRQLTSPSLCRMPTSNTWRRIQLGLWQSSWMIPAAPCFLYVFATPTLDFLASKCCLLTHTTWCFLPWEQCRPVYQGWLQARCSCSCPQQLHSQTPASTRYAAEHTQIQHVKGCIGPFTMASTLAAMVPSGPTVQPSMLHSRLHVGQQGQPNSRTRRAIQRGGLVHKWLVTMAHLSP